MPKKSSELNITRNTSTISHNSQSSAWVCETEKTQGFSQGICHWLSIEPCSLKTPCKMEKNQSERVLKCLLHELHPALLTAYMDKEQINLTTKLYFGLYIRSLYKVVYHLYSVLKNQLSGFGVSSFNWEEWEFDADWHYWKINRSLKSHIHTWSSVSWKRESLMERQINDDKEWGVTITIKPYYVVRNFQKLDNQLYLLRTDIPAFWFGIS